VLARERERSGTLYSWLSPDFFLGRPPPIAVGFPAFPSPFPFPLSCPFTFLSLPSLLLPRGPVSFIFSFSFVLRTPLPWSPVLPFQSRSQTYGLGSTSIHKRPIMELRVWKSRDFSGAHFSIIFWIILYALPRLSSLAPTSLVS